MVLSEAEAIVYDRQLRVWGVAVQQRLSSSKLLIAGCGGLAAEIAKNLVLAGVGSVTLMDGGTVEHRDPGNFLVPADAPASQGVATASQRMLQDINPLMAVEALESDVREVKDADFFSAYDAVIMLGYNLPEQCAVNALCRAASTKMFSGECRGVSAYYLSDQGRQEYRLKDAAGDEAQQMVFPTLEHSLANPGKLWHERTHWMAPALCAAYRDARSEDKGDIMAKLAQSLRTADLGTAQEALDGLKAAQAEVPAVAAVVGGILANDVLRCISQSGLPNKNCFLYSLHDGGAGSESTRGSSAGQGVFVDLDWE